MVAGASAPARGAALPAAHFSYRLRGALLVRLRRVALILFAFALAVAGAAFAALTTGDDPPSRPAQATVVGDDDANVMRVLQRDKRARKTP